MRSWLRKKNMNTKTLEQLLDKLLKLPDELEVLEFKEAKKDFSFDKLGMYFSALSNEANLRGEHHAWLIFGIENKNHKIVGTIYRKDRKSLDKLKGEIASKTTNGISFIEIYELQKQEGRVLLFQIPAAPKGIPVGFSGHYYGRNGEELSPLNIEEIDRIRKQATNKDWSAEIIPDANINDLDTAAIAFARTNYKNKFPEKSKEMQKWDDITFLNKAKITIKGKITRTAIILLGKEESEHFINPSEAKIRWILKDAKGTERDYQIVTCPIILAVDKIYKRIRNLKYRYMQEGTLFPEEVAQYEPYSIREAINNCIAHQDYEKTGRIDVIETDDQLIFSNVGKFIPGSVEKVIMDDAPEQVYRNQFLATAMFNLNLVDTVGGGIRKIFQFQQKRFFPMPEYDLSNGKVKVTIIGKVLDIDYARILAQNEDLTLEEILLLDKVQKKKKITVEEEKHLRTNGLIEGRKPNYFLSKVVAQKTGQKAVYSKNKAFDKVYYLDLILKAIEEHGFMERKELDDLLWKKLPDWMDDKQRKGKIHNLISELRKKEKIKNDGVDAKPRWVLF